MRALDWIVLISTLTVIILYGVWKSRKSKDMETYLRAHTAPWYMVGLTIMATQASAVTFLSAPGQAYVDGMRFVQYYFGLPLAMVVLCLTAVPIYHKLKVYTAYEYLEGRFDLKTRSLAASLFLIQRGLGTGITVFAPGLILSAMLGWNIYLTNAIICIIVVIYTVTGGIRAVSYTQMGQMAIILSGMVTAGVLIVKLLPGDVGLGEALQLGGKLGHMKIIDLKFDLNEKYNIWSGIIGGFFLALAYFGTDQSQVARYLNGKNITESRLGLLLNGIIKIPMQFGILLIGILLLVFYQFNTPPLFFNDSETQNLVQNGYAREYQSLEQRHQQVSEAKKAEAFIMLKALKTDDVAAAEASKNRMTEQTEEDKTIRKELGALMKTNNPAANTNDVNYIFLRFVTDHFPAGLVGLLIAVIMAASMASSSSALQALASTSIIDVYKRSVYTKGDDAHYMKASRWATVVWGVYVFGVACLAAQLGSLIEVVNILGSLFYGAVLGIFMVAFFMKSIKGNAVFIAACITQTLVLLAYKLTDTAFLWYNVYGCLGVMILAFVLQKVMGERTLVTVKNG